MHKLSALCAIKNYGNIHLITTEKGKEFLKGIPYTSIELFEEEPSDIYSPTWSSSKIYAYRQIAKKGERFLHIDYDVFLFKKINFPESDVIVQSYEDANHPWYNVPKALELLKNHYLLKEKSDYIAYNCGILGGNPDHILYYAEEALKLLNDKDNRDYWHATFELDHIAKSVVLEQLYLVYCCEKINSKVYFLFPTIYIDEKLAVKYGYTHLMGAKKDKTILDKVSKKLKEYEANIHISRT